MEQASCAVVGALLDQTAESWMTGVDVEGRDPADTGGSQARCDMECCLAEADESDGGLSHLHLLVDPRVDLPCVSFENLLLVFRADWQRLEITFGVVVVIACPWI